MDRAHQRLFRSESPYTLFWEDARRYELSLLRSGRDSHRKYVLIKTCVSDALPSLEDCRTVLAALRPLPHIQAKIDAFISQFFADKTVIAVHVRHGNGGDIMAHGKFWENEDQASDSITSAIDRAKLDLGQDSMIFLCTDSIETQQALYKAFPGLVTRDKYFRAAGVGELHDKTVIRTTQQASALGEDALIEMYLLAHADTLLCYPPESFFSYYARTVECGPSVRAIG